MKLLATIVVCLYVRTMPSMRACQSNVCVCVVVVWSGWVVCVHGGVGEWNWLPSSCVLSCA